MEAPVVHPPRPDNTVTDFELPNAATGPDPFRLRIRRAPDSDAIVLKSESATTVHAGEDGTYYRHCSRGDE